MNTEGSLTLLNPRYASALFADRPALFGIKAARTDGIFLRDEKFFADNHVELKRARH